MEKKEIGRVSHYFGKPSVAAIVLTDALKVGDRISIQGHTTDFETVVESIQIEHDSLDEAKAGTPTEPGSWRQAPRPWRWPYAPTRVGARPRATTRRSER
jgi:putative protease